MLQDNDHWAHAAPSPYFASCTLGHTLTRFAVLRHRCCCYHVGLPCPADPSLATCNDFTSAVAPYDGFYDFLTTLRAEVIKFKRPVAYVHGDCKLNLCRRVFYHQHRFNWHTSFTPLNHGTARGTP